MRSLIAAFILVAAVQAKPAPNIRQQAVPSANLLTDISTISQYWGQISPYTDNPENYFGVVDVGLPNGCQIEQVHLLQRHANRFPTGGDDDGGNDQNIAQKVMNFTKTNHSSSFMGPLAFLNSYEYIMAQSYLTGRGASTEFMAGVTFWNRYGRTLYNASLGQLAYNASFPNTLGMEYFYDYSFGNPTGRAQGIGYVQELLAPDFPLNQPFYVDFTHDDIIVSVLTALSMDYFRNPPTLTKFPPDPKRPFILSHMTPFGGRLITEVISCSSSNPAAVTAHRTQYYPTQYGYSASSATNKFIRMRLNYGVLPLNTIRGGCVRVALMACVRWAVSSRVRLVLMPLSNYDFACFGDYTIPNPTNGEDYDGTISARVRSLMKKAEM